jgi:amino acid adenylation domain-containing protein/thioester reductase-like protein
MRTGTQPTISQIRAELRQIISDVIGADLADVDDEAPLLDYVTSSLALLQGIRRVYDRFGVLIPIRPLLEGAGNLHALSAFIDEALKTHDKTARIARAEETREQGPQVAVVPSQQHIGFLARYSGGACSAYNEPLVLRLQGPLHGPALQAAIEAVAERCEAVRAALRSDSDAIIFGLDRLELPISHCSEIDLPDRVAGLAARPFEVGERLFRAELLRLSESDHVLALVGHALVVDREALMTVVEDIAEFYGVFARGEPARDLRPAVQLTQYMARHDAEAANPAHAAAEAYWRKVLADGFAPLELAGDRRRPAVKSYDGARLTLAVPPDLAASLQAWPDLSASTLLFGAFTAMLHRLAGQNDIVVGARSAPMYLNGEQRVVCTTRTMLPVRSHYQAERSFAAHVRATAARLAESDAHRQSLAEIIRLLKVPRDQSRSALFSAAFRAQAYDELPQFHSLRCTLAPVAIMRARYDIELILASVQDGMELWCDYSTELFEGETISRWLKGLLEFVRSGIADGEQPCGLLPIMPDHDWRLVLHDWAGEDRPYPRERTVLDLITDQVPARRDHVAIRCNGEDLTYARLAARIGEIARVLHDNAIRPGDRVAVLLRRTLDLVPSMLAAWRVGAAYVPLDPEMPKKRIALIVDDAAVRAIITTRDLVHVVEGQPGARPLCLDDASGQITGAVPETLAAGGADSAYVMYTSGSTGQPKGVEIVHSALFNCLLATRDLLEFSESSSLLAITTPSFDISTVELFMPLLAGGTVELGEEGLVADGIRLAERIDACKPSHLQATASTWKVVLAAGWSGDRGLCMGHTGEALSRDLAERLLPRGHRLWNLYGPTETTVYTTAHQVASGPDEPMRIGRPLPNTRAYILDEQLQPVPVGVVGELYIGGDGLARGYLRRPEVTHDRFIANPFRPGERMYRTGDLARYLSTGDIVCLGRVDHQAKIHGYRVELGEVEAALRAAGVGDAVVTAWVDANDDKQLVAHVLTNGGGTPTASELRERLRELLPEPMIPLHIVFTDAFPLMASGKVDRAALSSPDPARGANGGRAAPATPTERLVAEAWAKVLAIDAGHVSRDDDFIDLGGHSLLMTQLMVAVRRLFQVSFSMRDFFGASTVREFAALIDVLRRSASNEAASYQPVHARDSEWGRQRMAFLRREADLPSHIAPRRGLTFQPGQTRAFLLTGATGFLGAYLVAEILRTTDARLHCLVRAKQGGSQKARIEEQLRQYQLWTDDERWRSAWETRLHVVSGDLILPRLGLADAAYEALAREIDCIIHSAAHVNFIYPYEALKGTNVLGLHEIIRFAFHAHIKPVHYLSTAAIWPMGSEYTFYETDPLDHGKLLNLGYDEAKWVGERCLVNAAERGLPVACYRPGEVGGDSVTGRCVLNHFLIAAFKGFLQYGAFPQIDTHIDVAPVDYVAKAIVHIAFRGNPLGRAFHLTNPQSCHMTEALAFLRNAGYRFEERSFEDLRGGLVESPEFADNALFPYQAALESMDGRSFELPKYDCRHTQRELAGSGIICPPVDAKLFETYLNYLTGIGFLPAQGASAGRVDGAHLSGHAANAGHARTAPTHHATA